MNKTRLEAFSDGVIAIIITIMVLEIKVPHGEHVADLVPLWPVFLSYVLSFANVGIYWTNHHHLLHTIRHVNGSILMANLNLLFWLSLMPFTTGWMGENHFAAIPMALYALDLWLCACSYMLLQLQIIKTQGKDSVLSQALGRDWKSKISMAGFTLAIPLAATGFTTLAALIMVGVTTMWLIPDRRIERKFVAE
jgi:uncharacterized membrane protein